MKLKITIRPEGETDIDAIAQLTEAAFQSIEYSSHTEQFIVNGLRRNKQLTVSLVALNGEEIVGHVAISPVTISSGAEGWFGLGPISVAPEHQRKGTGSKMMEEALAELRRLGGLGCVVLGDPAYYGRFGFRVNPGLELPGVPTDHFLALSFGEAIPTGVVKYSDAFDATQ